MERERSDIAVTMARHWVKVPRYWESVHPTRSHATLTRQRIKARDRVTAERRNYLTSLKDRVRDQMLMASRPNAAEDYHQLT